MQIVIALLQLPNCFPGFYEWKTFDDKSKQPYLVYAPQSSDQASQQLGSLSDLKASDVWSESKHWSGPKPLFMAGLFSIWSAKDDPEGKKPIYSYSVITRLILAWNLI